MLTKSFGILRQVYVYAAVLALLNVIALACFLGVAVAGGSLDVERVRRAVAAFRDGPEIVADDEAVQQRPAETSAGAESLVDHAGAEAHMDMEILHREAERIKVELAQRLALNNSIMLKVRGERQAFQAEREAAAKRDEEQRKSIRDEGFEKQVAIFDSLSPKIAVQHLLGMNDPDAAAKILMALAPDRARKIVEAAKRDPELTQMQVILQRVREAAVPGAQLLSENG